MATFSYTLALFLACLLVSSFAGALLRWKNRHAEVEAEVRKPYMDKIEKLEKALSAYREIAESHTVDWKNWPEVGKEEWQVRWDYRSYDGNMENNLQHLFHDLEEFKDKRLRLTLSIHATRDWVKHLNNRGWTQPTNGSKMDEREYNKLNPFDNAFTGSREEVTEELLTHLKYMTSDLWDKKNNTWYLPDNPIQLRTKLEERALPDNATKPEVRFVEVKVAVPVESPATAPPRTTTLDEEERFRAAVETEVALALAREKGRMKNGA